MRLDIRGRVVHVTLSRRNLKALIAKLDGHPANSARTIATIANALKLIVTAEEDGIHYANRGYPPGPMVPETEEVL